MIKENSLDKTFLVLANNIDKVLEDKALTKKQKQTLIKSLIAYLILIYEK